MKRNLKILIGCLSILVIIIIFTMISGEKKNEKDVKQMRLTTDTTETSCSSTTCGGSGGTQYRHFKCGQTDTSVCSDAIVTSSCNVMGVCQGQLYSFHYLLKGMLGKFSILGGGNSTDVQIRKYATPGTSLSLPLANSSQAVNTITFPSGLSGTFLIMLFYPVSSNTVGTISVVEQQNMSVVSNYFMTSYSVTNDVTTYVRTNVMTNSDMLNGSDKLIYYILPVRINDESVGSSITFNCVSDYTLKAGVYADLFVIKASDEISICGTGNQRVSTGPNCRLGNLPLMARYQFDKVPTNVAPYINTDPFGLAIKNGYVYNENTQISDSIGLTFSQNGSTVTVGIPAVMSYTPYAAGTKINYLIMIQWFGASSQITPTVTFTGNSGGDYDIFKPFSYGTGETAVNSQAIDNIGNVGRRYLFICRTLRLAVEDSSSFTISQLIRPISASCGCNLVIIQTDITE
jgi:hypothetical protein